VDDALFIHHPYRQGGWIQRHPPYTLLSQAAQSLGMAKATLFDKVKKYGL
jgi:hypothetical protein